MKNKIFYISLFILISFFLLSSDEMINTYMKNARIHYIFKDYSRAYQYINFVLLPYYELYNAKISNLAFGHLL